MASSDEVDRALSALYRIHGITNPNALLEQLIREQRWDEAQHEIDQKLASIKEVLELHSTGAAVSFLFEPLERRLTKDVYILPPELEKVHPILLANITSGNTIDHFTHGGLLIYGATSGTGKTEYTMFLATQTGDKAGFVNVNISAIRGHQNPGIALMNLYEELEAKAVAEGVMYVALFDEFEKLVMRWGKQHSRVKEERFESVSSKRSSSRTRRESAETLEVDEVGEHLFSTLKTIVSGTKQIKHVFTIATSNQAAYPETLLRRLQPVELHPFGMPEYRIRSYDSAPDYSVYGEKLPRALQILQATHFRLHRKRSSVLDKIAGELSDLLRRLETDYKIPKDDMNVGEMAIRDNGYIEALLGYFGCDIEKERDGKNWDRNNILVFAGHFEKPIRNESYKPDGSGEEYRIRRVGHVPMDGTTVEVKVMKGLTPDAVAKWYKSNQDAFKRYRSVKKYIGQCIFPQLKALADYDTRKRKKPN